MRVEILTDPNMARRGARMLQAMIEAAPVEISVTEEYRGDCDVLMTYGNGHVIRRPWWFQHRAKGGRCIGWDLGYWQREQGFMRVTIDHDHPQAMIRPEPPERFNACGIKLRNDYRANGPAVVVGLGKKTLSALGLEKSQWESSAIEKARALELKVVFKPKGNDDYRPRKTALANGPIEEVLIGASLVLCRHSNVAVDACIAGVPVICEDGAAFALYSKKQNPTPDERLQFLRSLAWWQWKSTEAPEAWKYLLARLSA